MTGWAGLRALAAAGGLVADRALGEPGPALHPVARFGQAMAALEARTWADRRGAGIRHAAVGVGGAALVGGGLRAVVGPSWATVVATEVAVAGRMLHRVALDIGDALDAGDLDGARALLPALVGRDATRLDPSGVARAVVESVAENTVDAVVAPVLWAAVGGAPAVLAHRALNTLDAMVGHRTARHERFGWASARLDDAAAWVPARVTALAVVVARPRAARAVWVAVRTQAPAHPSPNAGVAEAAFAAALGLRLGGEVAYGDVVEDRGELGAGRAPEAHDVARAVALARRVGGVVAAGLALPGALAVARTVVRHRVAGPDGRPRRARYGARRRRAGSTA